MTTKLAGNATFFLPFNMGNGEGVNAGAGNPTFEDKYSVSYMWEDILTKDTVLDLISKFIFIESKETEDELTGKKKTSENVIFPRYHQLDVIRKVPLLSLRRTSVRRNQSSKLERKFPSLVTSTSINSLPPVRSWNSASWNSTRA